MNWIKFKILNLQFHLQISTAAILDDREPPATITFRSQYEPRLQNSVRAPNLKHCNLQIRDSAEISGVVQPYFKLPGFSFPVELPGIAVNEFIGWWDPSS